MKIVIDIPEKTYKYAKKYANSPILSVRDIDRCMDAISKGEIEQEPKTGHWQDADYMDEWWGQVYICSECGESMIGKSNYCADCGARMEEVSE